MLKRILQLTSLALIGLVVYYVFHRSTLETITVYKAKIEPYTHYIYANIEIRPKHLYHISVSRYPDTIVEMPWKVGDHVRWGDMLMRLDNEKDLIRKDTIFAREQNMQDIGKLKTSTQWNILTTTEELKYMQEEFNKSTVPEIEIRKLEDKLSLLDNKNQREEYYQNYGLDRLQLQKTAIANRVENKTINSPISGVISEIYKEPGEYLAVGEVAMDLYEDKKLEIIGEVFEEDIEYLQKGRSAILELNAYAGQKFKGKVDMIYPKNDQELQKIEVRIACDELPENVAPGLKGLASFEVAYTDFEVVIPSTAVFRSKVQVVEDGRVRTIPIEIGFKGLFQNVIRSGLPEGSIIVQEYREDFKDGQKINPVFRSEKRMINR